MNLTVKIPKSEHCNMCRKKTLVPMDCKCGLTFCIAHRDAELHQCCYNYKKDAIKLPKIVGEKVDRI